MLPCDAKARLQAVRGALKPETDLAFMATTSGPWACSTAVASIEYGATRIDAKKETIRVWIHEMPKENWGIAQASAKDLGR